jgi:crossover junction endodeoxyribonuclease RusA
MIRSLSNPPSLRRAVERVELALPMPISTNALFVTGKNGRRFKTKAYRAWIAEAGWRLVTQRPGRIDGRYNLEIIVPRDSRIDLDNHCKCLQDLLVRHEVVSDDRFAENITMSRSGDDAGVRVVLTKWEA